MPESPSHSLSWLESALGELEARGLRRRLATRCGPQGPSIVLDGQTLLNFGSNDYLGLAGDPRLAAAAIDAIQREGWGSGASPLITGRADSFRDLERRLAEFEAAEAALVFPSGFAANVGAIASLVDRQDAIFADQKNHASLIDGCRLSRASLHVYRHADLAHLADLLATCRSPARNWIVTDSLFSMDGDLAPLPELAALAQQNSALLIVDEAHATGVFGPHGRGLCEFFGVEDQVAVRIGTLSKALGCGGGFVVGRRSLIDWLANRARPYVFSTAQPSANAAAAIAALEIVVSEPHRREELLSRAAEVQTTLRTQGWITGVSRGSPAQNPHSPSQIIPLFVGDPNQAMALSAELRSRGLFVPGIRPPSVPEGESLLRISLSWCHDPPALDKLCSTLAELATTCAAPPPG